MSWDPYPYRGGWGVLITMLFRNLLGSIGWARPHTSPQENPFWSVLHIYNIDSGFCATVPGPGKMDLQSIFKFRKIRDNNGGKNGRKTNV